MRYVKWILCTLCLILISSSLLFYYQIKYYANQPLPIKHPCLITLPLGINRNAVILLLQNANLLKKPSYLLWLWRFHPQLAQFKAGTYQVKPQMSLRALLNLLYEGKVAQFNLRFVEGSSCYQWIQQLHNAPYIKHTLQHKTVTEIAQLLNMPYDHPEGWWFPDTYYYTADTQDIEILQKAYQKMKIELDFVWQKREPNLPLKSSYELLILASIIEKETSVEDERAKIASVFFNRLQRNMRLQADPTVIYGLGMDYMGKLTRNALAQANIYNTYLNYGLPPTPIAMPSIASLQAAANPASTNYLYFMANGVGGHQFSTNLKAHQQAIRYYLSNR